MGRPDRLSRGDLVRTLPSAASAPASGNDGDEAPEAILVTPSSVLAKAIRTRLANGGLRVTTCSTPWSALEVAVWARPDLIIALVVMDHVGGVDLVCALLRIEATAHTPMIVLTANESRDGARRVLDAGMNDHVAKPILRDALMAAIARQTRVAAPATAPRGGVPGAGADPAGSMRNAG